MPVKVQPLNKKLAAGLTRLPKRVVDSLYALMTMIELMGPVRGDWPNYSKLAKGVHHCHLKKGNPTYEQSGKNVPTAPSKFFTLALTKMSIIKSFRKLAG